MTKLLFARPFLIAILGAIFLGACTEKKSEPTPPALQGVLPPVNATPGDPVVVATQAVNQAPSYEHVITLGLELEKTGRSDEALAAYQRAATIYPQGPVAWNNICSIETSRARYANAITACNRALAADENFQLAKNNLKIAVVKEDEAKKHLVAHFEQEVKKTGQTTTQLVNRGMDYYSVKEYSLAILLWKKISKGDVLYATAQNDIASADILLKKYADADLALKQAEALDPKNQLFINNRKWLEAERASPSSGASGKKPSAKKP